MRRFLFLAVLALSIFQTFGSASKAIFMAFGPAAGTYVSHLSRTINVYHDKLVRGIGGKMTIRVGRAVLFKNLVNMRGGHTHTLVADDGSFTSKPLVKSGDTWHHTFGKAGTYRYRIREHSDVTGTILVKQK